MQQRDVFLYHLDNEVQKLFSIEYYNMQHVEREFEVVTKVGFLICKNAIYIPASNYFESDLAYNILNKLKDFRTVGAIKLLSSSYNLKEFLSKKSIQYGEAIVPPVFHYKDFYDPGKESSLPGQMKKRKSSATDDIKASWYRNLSNSEFKEELYRLHSNEITASKFEDSLYEMPCKLGARAYISDYIVPLIPIEKQYRDKANYMINAFITKEYILSFLNEYDAVCLKDLPIIDDAVFLCDTGINAISYSDIVKVLITKRYKGKNLFKYIKDCTAKELIEFKYSIYGDLLLQEIFEESSNDKISMQVDKLRKEKRKVREKVFIVHGHDDAAKANAARVVECLGFEAIILHEQVSSGRTIIEKIEEYSDVAFAIVLYTECDLGRDKNDPVKKERPRARQNVVFEHGYLMGKLSRDKVCAFVKGDIEMPGDVSGVVYTKMDDNGGWKLELAKNMKAAGLDIDMNKLIGI